MQKARRTLHESHPGCELLLVQPATVAHTLLHTSWHHQASSAGEVLHLSSTDSPDL
uniref:Uncharacterized protein n=1 Tax=Arundo donax TaxID=35708 RepID=A0A0A9AVM1_ARUDO